MLQKRYAGAQDGHYSPVECIGCKTIALDRDRDAPTRPAAVAPEDDHPMDQAEQEFGTPNPDAPAALSRFAFLIGKWRCEARVRLADGEWQTLHGTWLGRFILDGYAFAHCHCDGL